MNKASPARMVTSRKSILSVILPSYKQIIWENCVRWGFLTIADDCFKNDKSFTSASMGIGLKEKVRISCINHFLRVRLFTKINALCLLHLKKYWINSSNLTILYLCSLLF